MNNSPHVLLFIFPVQTLAVLQQVRISQLLTLLAYLSIAMWTIVVLSMLVRSLLHSLHHASTRPVQKSVGPTETTRNQTVKGGTAWTSEL